MAVTHVLIMRSFGNLNPSDNIQQQDSNALTIARARFEGLPTLILLFCRLRLEASSANATTPHRRNLRANDLHLITAARRTFRLMTHDLLATFIYVAHFVFTQH